MQCQNEDSSQPLTPTVRPSSLSRSLSAPLPTPTLPSPSSNLEVATSSSTPSEFDPNRLVPQGVQLSAANWFLTYPRNPTSKEVALDRLKNRFASTLLGVLIAQEQHQDGEKHLHILVRFSKALKTRDRNIFDFVCGKHGNYQTVRSQYAIYNYLNKEDPTPLLYGDIPNPGSEIAKFQAYQKKANRSSGGPRVSKASTIATDLLSGSQTTMSTLVADPGYYLLNKRKIEEFGSLCSILLRKKQLLKLQLPLPLTTTQDPSTLSIIEWLNSNFVSSRPLREKQLYVFGATQRYKTMIVELLKLFYMAYEIPKGEDFYDFYDDQIYDFAYMDEYLGQKTIQWLNDFLGGSMMTIRKKGSQYIKLKNLPVIILSNYPLEEVYATALEKNSKKLDPLYTRLTIVQLTTRLDLKGLAESMGVSLQHPLLATTTLVPPSPVPRPTSSAPLLALTTSGQTQPSSTKRSVLDQHNRLDHLQSFKRHKTLSFCKWCGYATSECICENTGN